jgi:MFS family permease
VAPRETRSSSDDATCWPRFSRTVALSLATFTLAVLPVFLLGGLANQVRAELEFGEGALGGAVAIFWAIGALGSSSFGRLAERTGAGRGLRVALLLDAGGLASVAVLARSWVTLALSMALCGVANAAIQPASALYLAHTVPLARRGRAFGFTLAAVPLATLIAGLAIPTIAVTVGWRWVFVGASIAALAVCWRVPVRPQSSHAQTSMGTRPPLKPLVVLALGAGLAAAATGSLASFLVSGATTRGLSETQAGWVFVAGSVVSLATRLALGFVADRPGRGRIQLAAAMLVVGAVSIAWLGIGSGLSFALGAVVAFALAWGWPGLLGVALVELSPSAPAHATGVTMTGTYLGGVVGPPVFGYLVEFVSFRAGWLLASVWAASAGGVLFAGHRLATRSSLPALGVRTRTSYRR